MEVFLCKVKYVKHLLDFPGSSDCDVNGVYSLEAPGPKKNALCLLRAMQLGRPLLLEGPPGVGKTSLVIALAELSGHRAVRINLSEQTVSKLIYQPITT